MRVCFARIPCLERPADSFLVLARLANCSCPSHASTLHPFSVVRCLVVPCRVSTASLAVISVTADALTTVTPSSSERLPDTTAGGTRVRGKRPLFHAHSTCAHEYTDWFPPYSQPSADS